MSLGSRNSPWQYVKVTSLVFKCLFCKLLILYNRVTIRDSSRIFTVVMSKMLHGNVDVGREEVLMHI